MSRYTGPSWKQSRRLGISLSGTGKELARRHTLQVNMDQTAVERNLNTACKCQKNKNYVSSTD